MSWDIYVQDFPSDIGTVEDIPDNYMPKPIGTRADITNQILEVIPSADFSDPSFGKVEGSDYSIGISLGKEEVINSFALQVYGGGMAAGVIADILRHLSLRGIETGSGDFFDFKSAQSSFEKWQAYREQILRG
jgi:hypothetical protein